MKYQYFLFDWDGCLADTLSLWLRAYDLLLKEKNILLTSDQIVSDFFGGGYEGPQKHGLDGEEFYVELMPRVSTSLQSVSLHPNVKETLEDLKSKEKKLAIVSTSYSTEVKPALGINKLEDLFDTVVCGDDVTRFKPDPEPLEKAMREIAAYPEETIMIGDSEKDILAGKNTGVATALFYPEVNQKLYIGEVVKSLRADYFFTDFRDLLQLA